MTYLRLPARLSRQIMAVATFLGCVFVAGSLTAQPQEMPEPKLNGDSKLVMNFRDATLQAILDYLSEQAGLIVINQVELDDRVTVFNLQPVSLDEALDMLNSVLRDQGFTTIRRERLLRIVPLNDAKRMSVPVRMGNDPGRIGLSDTIITQIVPIRYADAAALVENLQPLVEADYAELAANESSNSLIVTNTEANVRRIVEIAQALDQSISQVRDVRVFHLTHADADDVAELITDVFEQGPSEDEQFGRAVRRRFGGGPGGRGGGDNDDDNPSGAGGREVSAAADERTNSVVVSADPTIMEAISTMIEQLDTDTAAKQGVMVYHAKNTLAVDLEALFSALFSGTTIDRGGDGDTTLRNNNPVNFFGPGGNNNRGNNNAEAGTGSASDLVGNVVAVADESTNSLLVLTPEINFDRIRAILDDLDRPVPQVLVRVLVAELTHEEGLDFGTEWAADFEPGGDNLIQALTTFGAPTTGLSLAVLGSDYTATITALETEGVLDVLSRPYILTRDNQEATITVGEEVPIPTDTRVTESGNTISSVDYRDTGIILGVTPQINEDGLVVLNVTQELSSLLQSTVQISEDFSAPRIAKRSADTRIAVMTGQTVVIGGLMQESITQNISKVPLLGDLPIVGGLFKREQTDKAKTELLLFLTPEVVMTPDDLVPMSQRVRAESETIDQTVAPGALQRHLDHMGGAAAGHETPAPEAEVDE